MLFFILWSGVRRGKRDGPPLLICSYFLLFPFFPIQSKRGIKCVAPCVCYSLLFLSPTPLGVVDDATLSFLFYRIFHWKDFSRAPKSMLTHLSTLSGIHQEERNRRGRQRKPDVIFIPFFDRFVHEFCPPLLVLRPSIYFYLPFFVRSGGERWRFVYTHYTCQHRFRAILLAPLTCSVTTDILFPAAPGMTDRKMSPHHCYLSRGIINPFPTPKRLDYLFRAIFSLAPSLRVGFHLFSRSLCLQMLF